MRVSITIPNHAELLCRVLEGLIEAGRLEIESGAVDPGPPEDLELVEDEDVHDPSAGEHWQLPSETAEHGGDCKDVSVWRAASLRASGEDEEATVQIWQTGPRDLHCVVLRGDGSTEDVWSQLRDGTWRLGFGLSDLNPINGLKSLASNMSSAYSSVKSNLTGAGNPLTMNSAGRGVGPGNINARTTNVSWLNAARGFVNPTTGYTLAPTQGYTVMTGPPAPTPTPVYPPNYPPGYNPYGAGGFGGIPTAPAYPTYGGGGYGGGGYGGGGYPSGDPYAGIPYYDGDDDDIEEDDDQDELREELAELRGELRGQRRAMRSSSSSSRSADQDQADDGAGS
jgi:hypothetical protein